MIDQPNQTLLPNNDAVLRNADKKRSKLTDTEVNLLRRHVKTDLFFLGETVLGHKDYSVDLHGQVSVWNQRNWASQFKIILLPRSHLKSSQMTIADSVQIVLPDDSGNLPHPRNLGTNNRLLICHEVLEQAASFLTPITDAFRLNEYLITLFPECVPGKSHKINKYQLELPRANAWPEPTIDTMGVGTRGQGRHYTYIKLDDIYGAEARDSKAGHDAIIKWIGAIQSFLVTPMFDHIDFIGTRYRKDDVYGYVMNAYKNRLKKFIKPVWERNEKNERIFIYPERFSWESTEDLRADPQNWNSNYLNNPLEGDVEFKLEWERYFTKIYSFRTGRLEAIAFSDDAGTERKVDLLSMDRIIFVDPATTGNTGIIVTGTDDTADHPNVFCLESIQGIFDPKQLIDKIFALCDKYNPRLVVIEEVLFSKVYQDWMKSEMRHKQRYINVVGAKTNKIAKEDRVRALIPWFSNAQIYFSKEQTDLIEQYREFGSIKEYHILDALAYGVRYWRAFAGGLIDSSRESGIETLRAMRDKEMGYSEIKYAGT